MLFIAKHRGTQGREITNLSENTSLSERPDKLKLESESVMVCRMVGTNNSLKVGVWGTDLGIPVITYINGQKKIAFLFGDVFSPPSGGANAIAYADFPIDGCPDLTWVTDEKGRFREMWSSQRKDGVDASTVPAGAIDIDGTLYVYAMRVTHWKKKLSKDDVTHAYGVLFKHTSNGEYVETDVRWGLDSKFVNVAPVLGRLPDGSKVLFLVASGQYRESPIYLAYVSLDHIEDIDYYMYFTGLVDGQPQWSPNIEEAVPIIDSVNVGELSIIYHDKLGLYILMFKDWSLGGGLKIMTAHDPWGPYSDPTTLSPCYPKPSWFDKNWGGCYGGYLVPGSYGVDGKDLYYILSIWRPYATFLMKIRLTNV